MKNVPLLLALAASLTVLPSAHAASGKAGKGKASPPPAAVVETPPPPPPVDPLAWRATPPAAATTTWEAPLPVRFTLGNGVPVVLLSRPDLPLLTVRLLVGATREANPAGKAGLASLVANLLDEGTKTRSSLQIASEADSLGATLVTGTTDEYAYVSVNALSAGAAAALDLMADVVLHPKFDKNELDRVKGDLISELQRRRGEPRDNARTAFAASLFGANHPYGVADIGTETSLAGLQVKDLQTFYRQYWHAGNATLVVAGSVDEAGARALLEPRFGTWKAKAGFVRPSVPKVDSPPKVKLVFVEAPGAVQSVIRVGQVGIVRKDPDYAATLVMGNLLGGMFSSRINMNLREEHGWSYGAGGNFNAARELGVYAVGAGVQADKTAEAVAEIFKEIRKMQESEPSPEELALARDAAWGDLAGLFETNADTAQLYSGLPTFGLPDDAVRSYLDAAKRVTAAQVLSLAKGKLNADRMVVVVAGPAKLTVPGEGGAPQEIDIVARLNALGLGTVERFTAP